MLEGKSSRAIQNSMWPVNILCSRFSSANNEFIISGNSPMIADVGIQYKIEYRSLLHFSYKNSIHCLFPCELFTGEPFNLSCSVFEMAMKRYWF